MYNISLVKPKWEIVFVIPKKSHMEKGKNKTNKKLLEKAALVKDKYGCYSWTTDSIQYCGSFSKDYKYRPNHNNLESRIHQYLYNHSTNKKNGEPMTNLNIFNNIKKELKSRPVKLKKLSFEKLLIANKKVSFKKYCITPLYVEAVEQLLIYSLRAKGKCKWNR